MADLVKSELNRRAELRVANYDTVLMLWVGSDGRIRRVSTAKSTGIAKMDQGIRDALTAAPATATPPPPDMPQPVHLKITSTGATGEVANAR